MTVLRQVGIRFQRSSEDSHVVPRTRYNTFPPEGYFFPPDISDRMGGHGIRNPRPAVPSSAFEVIRMEGVVTP